MGEAMSQQAVDWFRLLWDLMQRDLALSDVATMTGQHRETVRGYLYGSQPPHWRGELLIELWCEVCKKPREDVPVCELTISPRVMSRPDIKAEREVVDALTKAWR